MRIPEELMKAWLPIAVAATGAIGAAYLLVQQDFRQSANDPQIRLAEDAASYLTADPKALDIVPPESGLDLATSSAPFLAVYDDAEKPLAWSMKLDKAAPVPPKGVFAYAKAHGEDRVTWQPRPGIRFALVMVSFKKPDGAFGFAASGRSLREVESREAQAEALAAAGWLASMTASLLACWIVRGRKSA